MTALALDNVTARFGDTPVLGPLSLALKTGERVALVGKSGAGKSTLLSLLYDEARETGVYMPQDLGLVETCRSSTTCSWAGWTSIPSGITWPT